MTCSPFLYVARVWIFVCIFVCKYIYIYIYLFVYAMHLLSKLNWRHQDFVYFHKRLDKKMQTQPQSIISALVLKPTTWRTTRPMCLLAFQRVYEDVCQRVVFFFSFLIFFLFFFYYYYFLCINFLFMNLLFSFWMFCICA